MRKDELKGGTRAMISISGTGALGTLTIILIILKLMGKISCSWIWVFSPFWIPSILIFLGFSIVFAIALHLNK